jgi:hypothetical protein
LPCCSLLSSAPEAAMAGFRRRVGLH